MLTSSSLYPRSTLPIPVIASSGAGKVEHFSEVFKKTDVEAALQQVFAQGKSTDLSCKKHLLEKGIEIH